MWLAWLSGLGRSRCLFELHILGSMQTKRFSILSDMASRPVSGRVSGRACVTSLALAVVWGAVRGPLLRRADALFRGDIVGRSQGALRCTAAVYPVAGKGMKSRGVLLPHFWTAPVVTSLPGPWPSCCSLCRPGGPVSCGGMRRASPS